MHGLFSGGGEMGALMRAHDWDATPLGPPSAWPQSLRSAVSICLGCAFPIAIYWGPDLALLYNDAWSPIPGEKHPWALGRAGREVWPEIWNEIGPLYEKVQTTGEGVWQQDQLLPMRRHGYTEECYFNFTFSPIRGDASHVEGIFNAVVETTFRVIGERRTQILRNLAEQTLGARSAEEACAAASKILEGAPADLPFFQLYLREPGADASRGVRLVSSCGFASDGAAHPENSSLDDPQSVWPLAAVNESRQTTVLKTLGDRGLALATRFWPEPADSALVAPLLPTGFSTSGEPLGFLVAGLSPRRALDIEYQSFIERVAAHIAAAVSNARAYQEERRRAEALAEIDRAKTLFFSNVSHEFRTPLTLMLGPLEDALNDSSGSALNAVQRHRLDTAHRNSTRLLRLVNTLLDFSRLEAGRAEAHHRPTDLAVFTADLASNFRSVTEKAGLRLRIDCPPLSEPVYVDQEMWEKIVLNLLSNAFKFTFEGEIAVELAATADGRAVELTVRDTGVGIPASELPRMFERFHRVDNQKSRSFEGSGIGLALIQEIVRLHSGTIRVESEVGKGSAFTVSIPAGMNRLSGDRRDDIVAVPTALAPSIVEEAARWLTDGATAPLSGVLEDTTPVHEVHEGVSADPAETMRPRVLIADDNADMRDYLQRLLKPLFDVVTVADGQAALDAARVKRPNIILSDVMMPQLDGFELLKAIRSESGLRELPVILLSARAGEEAKIEGLNAGADDYLVKPFSARELIARIQANLEMARIRKAAEDALRKRTTELETVLETIPTAVWFTHNAEASRVTGNRHAADLLRIPVEADLSLSAISDGKMDFRIFHNSREMLFNAFPIQRAARGETVSEEELELRFDDGSRVTILVRAAPLRDAAGTIHGAVCAAVDVTERKRSEDQRTLLINELNHRVKNTLATVQSLAMQTLRNTERSADARDLFESRLASLSRAHDTLTEQNWESVSLHELVNRAMEPFQTTNKRLRVDGPDVRLSPRQALALSMALHELATNAVKYGALSNTAGNVDIAWTMTKADKSAEIELVWTEQGGPVVDLPTRRGFGSRLIERGLSHDLGGAATIEYRPEGVVSVIRTAHHVAGDKA